MASDSNKKIILYCHNNYLSKKGGEYNVYVNDISLLENKGYKIIRYEKNNDELLRATWLKKILLVLSSFFSFKTYREINKLIKTEKIDYAFIQNTYLIISPSIYLILFKNGIPIIQMIYNYRFICANAHLYIKNNICEKCICGDKFNSVVNRCVKNSYLISFWYYIIILLNKKIYFIDDKISAFIVPDEFSMNKLVQANIKKEKIFIAKNPFILMDSNEIEDDGFFLFIGRLIKQKGIYTFLEAAKKVSNIKFKIIGEGEEEIKIMEFIKSNRLSNIDFLGALYGNEMLKVLRKARALIVPSEWYDNYPVVISNAYNYCKPVIATNINGLPEVVIDNSTGLLFNYKNIEELCEKINYLSADSNIALEIGKKGRIFLETELNAEKRLNKIEEVLNQF